MKQKQVITVIIVVLILFSLAYLFKVMPKRCPYYQNILKRRAVIIKEAPVVQSGSLDVPASSKVIDYNKNFFINMPKDAVDKKSVEMEWEQVNYYKKGNEETLTYGWNAYLISFYFIDGQLKRIKEQVGYIISSGE